MDFLCICGEEIALEGLDGCPITKLWQNLAQRKPPFPTKIDDGVKAYLWKGIVENLDVKFYALENPLPHLFNNNTEEDKTNAISLRQKNDDNVRVQLSFNSCHMITDGDIRGSCPEYDTRQDITPYIRTTTGQCLLNLQQAVERWGDHLVMVASQDMRTRSMIGDQFDPAVPLTPNQYCLLEHVGQSRMYGRLQRFMTSYIKVDMKTLFFLLKNLSDMGLIKKQKSIVHAKNANVASNAVRLKRFCISPSKHRYDALGLEVCQFLETQPNQIISLIDFMKHFDKFSGIRHRKTMKNVRKYLERLGNIKSVVIRNPSLRSDDNVGREKMYIQLVKPFELKNNEDDDDDDNQDSVDEVSDYPNLVMEIPILKQIYDYIESKGPNGVTSKEIEDHFQLFKNDNRAAIKLLEIRGNINHIMTFSGKQSVIRFVAIPHLEASKHTQKLLEEQKKLDDVREKIISQTIEDDTSNNTSVLPDSRCSSPTPSDQSSVPPAQFGRVTYRSLKRNNFIIGYLEQKKVVEGRHNILKALIQAEEEEGLETKVDRRVLHRALTSLIDSGIVKKLKTVIDVNDATHTVEFYLHSSVKPHDPQVKTAIEACRFRLSGERSKDETKKPAAIPVKKESDDEEEESDEEVVYWTRDIRHSYGFLAKFPRMQLIHEFIWQALYGENKKKQDYKTSYELELGGMVESGSMVGTGIGLSEGFSTPQFHSKPDNTTSSTTRKNSPLLMSSTVPQQKSTSQLIDLTTDANRPTDKAVHVSEVSQQASTSQQSNLTTDANRPTDKAVHVSEVSQQASTSQQSDLTTDANRPTDKAVRVSEVSQQASTSQQSDLTTDANRPTDKAVHVSEVSQQASTSQQSNLTTDANRPTDKAVHVSEVSQQASTSQQSDLITDANKPTDRAVRVSEVSQQASTSQQSDLTTDANRPTDKAVHVLNISQQASTTHQSDVTTTTPRNTAAVHSSGMSQQSPKQVQVNTKATTQKPKSKSTGELNSTTHNYGWIGNLDPLPRYDEPKGWVRLNDLLKIMPLSILCNAIGVCRKVNFLDDYYNDPMKCHIPYKDLPKRMQKKLNYKGRSKDAFADIISQLICAGLLMPEKSLPSERLQTMVFFNQGAILLDTSKGFHVGDFDVKTQKSQFISSKFVFNDFTDVQSYWTELKFICLRTCFKRNARAKLLSSNASGEDEYSKDQSNVKVTRNFKFSDSLTEMMTKDNITVPPGDGNGAAGLDSFLYSHLTRNWTFCSGNYNKFRVFSSEKRKLQTQESPKPSNKKQRTEQSVEKAKPKRKQREDNKSVPSKKQKTDEPKCNKPSLERRGGHTTGLDETDKAALAKKMGLRVSFSPENDRILLLCRVALEMIGFRCTFKSNNYLHIRNILHKMCPDSYDKTVTNCRARIMRLVKNPKNVTTVRVCVAEYSTLPEFAGVKDRSVPFKERFNKTINKLIELSSKQVSSVEDTSHLFGSIDEIYQNFRLQSLTKDEKPLLGHELPNSLGDPISTVQDIRLAVARDIIQITCKDPLKTSVGSNTYRMLDNYSLEDIAKAGQDLERDGVIRIIKDRTQHSRSKPYKLSHEYAKLLDPSPSECITGSTFDDTAKFLDSCLSGGRRKIVRLKDTTISGGKVAVFLSLLVTGKVTAECHIPDFVLQPTVQPVQNQNQPILTSKIQSIQAKPKQKHQQSGEQLTVHPDNGKTTEVTKTKSKQAKPDLKKAKENGQEKNDLKEEDEKNSGEADKHTRLLSGSSDEQLDVVHREKAPSEDRTAEELEGQDGGSTSKTANSESSSKQQQSTKLLTKKTSNTAKRSNQIKKRKGSEKLLKTTNPFDGNEALTHCKFNTTFDVSGVDSRLFTPRLVSRAIQRTDSNEDTFKSRPTRTAQIHLLRAQPKINIGFNSLDYYKIQNCDVIMRLKTTKDTNMEENDLDVSMVTADQQMVAKDTPGHCEDPVKVKHPNKKNLPKDSQRHVSKAMDDIISHSIDAQPDIASPSDTSGVIPKGDFASHDNFPTFLNINPATECKRLEGYPFWINFDELVKEVPSLNEYLERCKSDGHFNASDEQVTRIIYNASSDGKELGATIDDIMQVVSKQPLLLQEMSRSIQEHLDNICKYKMLLKLGVFIEHYVVPSHAKVWSITLTKNVSGLHERDEDLSTEKDNQQSSSLTEVPEGISPMATTEGIPPTASTEGISPTASTEGISPTASTEGISPTASTEGIPPTASTEGIPPTASTEGIPPTATTEGIPPTASTEGISPTATIEGISPTATTEGIPPTASTEGISPTASTEGISPTASTEGISPTASTEGISPTASTEGISPTASTEGISPTATTEGIPPTASTEGISPTASTEGISPTASTEGISPTASTEGISPTASTEDISPTASTEGISPTASTEGISPTASTEGISPTASTEGISPTASTEDISPIATTEGIPPTASTEDISPIATTEGIPPTASTEGISPTASTEDISPIATTEGIPPTASTEGISPIATTEGIPPTASTEDISPTASTEGISPTASTEGISPTASTEDISPTASTEGIPPTASTEGISPTATIESISPTTSTEGIPPTATTGAIPPTAISMLSPVQRLKSQDELVVSGKQLSVQSKDNSMTTMIIESNSSAIPDVTQAIPLVTTFPEGISETSETIVSSEDESSIANVNIISLPWLDMEGQVNLDIMKPLLYSLTSTIIRNPGITETRIIKKFLKVAKPVPLGHVFQYLMDIGCITKHEMTAKKPALFSSDSDVCKVSYFLPTVDCVVKLAKAAQAMT